LIPSPIIYGGYTTCPSCGATVYGWSFGVLSHMRRVQLTTASGPNDTQWEPCPAGRWTKVPGWRPAATRRAT